MFAVCALAASIANGSTNSTVLNYMDAYISSNSPELSALLARTHITSDDRTKLVTPMSSPQLARKGQRCRTPQSNVSASQVQLSPTDSSEYGDSSLERSIANLTFEEIAILSGRDIIEISTDESSESEGDTSPALPRILPMEFSQNPITLARRAVLVESLNQKELSGKDFITTPAPSLKHVAIEPSTRPRATRTGGQHNLASTSNASRTNGWVAAVQVGANPSSPSSSELSSSEWPSSPSFSQRGTESSDETESSVHPSRGPPSTPPRTPPPVVLQERPLYQITTPAATEFVEGWDNAGPRYLTQPLAHCVKLTGQRRRRRHAYPAYAVLKGRITGVFTCSWDELRGYVLNVSHANYKGYDRLVQAQAAYMIGYSLGLVQVVEDDDDTASDTSTAPSSVVPRHPTADEVYHALEGTSNAFLGPEWLVVFRGTRPGIYPSWTFVSSMVSGISTSVYEKFATKEEAEIRWREALRAGQVQNLLPGVSYVRHD